MEQVQKIFSYEQSWRGRWGDEHEYCVTIIADLQDPTKWPFQLKKQSAYEDDDGKMQYEPETVQKLSKALFQKLKQLIGEHQELAQLPEKIDNGVSDGVVEAFYFCCDSFSAFVHGSSVLSSADYEEEHPHPEDENRPIGRVFNAIEQLLRENGLTLWQEEDNDN